MGPGPACCLRSGSRSSLAARSTSASSDGPIHPLPPAYNRASTQESAMRQPWIGGVLAMVIIEHGLCSPVGGAARLR